VQLSCNLFKTILAALPEIEVFSFEMPAYGQTVALHGFGHSYQNQFFGYLVKQPILIRLEQERTEARC
jgi:hypothetical protein